MKSDTPRVNILCAQKGHLKFINKRKSTCNFS